MFSAFEDSSIRINSLSQFYVSATVSGLMSPTESGSELIDEKMKLCMASDTNGIIITLFIL